MIKKIEKVKIDEMQRLLELYLMPLFDDRHSNCLIVAHSAKADSIYKDFAEK